MPTKHRDALSADSNQITITRHPHGSLMIFPRPAWEVFSGQVARLPMDALWWRRIFLGNAFDVEMDSTGRVLVSPELREAVGITKEVILLGMGGYFELWDKPTYVAKQALAMEGEMPDVLNGLTF